MLSFAGILALFASGATYQLWPPSIVRYILPAGVDSSADNQPTVSVENFISSSEDLTGSAWTDPLGNTTVNSATTVTWDVAGLGLRQNMSIGLLTGRKFTVRFKARSISGITSLSLDLADESTNVITIDSTLKDYSFTSSTNFTGKTLLYLDVFTTQTGQIEFTDIQVEEVTGQSNTNPSEYVEDASELCTVKSGRKNMPIIAKIIPNINVIVK